MSPAATRPRLPNLHRTLPGRPSPASVRRTDSGANRDRTGDLWLAKPALSQLSYGPQGVRRGPEQNENSAGALRFQRGEPGPQWARRRADFAARGPAAPGYRLYWAMKTPVAGLLIPVLLAGCGDNGGRAGGEPGRTPPVAEDSASGPAPPASASPAAVPGAVDEAEPAAKAATSEAESRPRAEPGTIDRADGTPRTTEPASFLFPRPEHVRGLYVNSWSAGSRRRLAELTDLAGRTEVNTFVIDIKDASGYVSHPTEVPMAREIGATGDVRIPSPSRLLGRLEEAGIYPVARIVIVKDPVLAAARPDLAVQDTAGGVWADNAGKVWLNPYNREVWDYHVDLAREVATMGFPEIQWDYVRFPDATAPALARARFPGREGRSRAAVIREFLAYSREEISEVGARVTADVFGVTTSAAGDVGIGQVWESFIDVVDAALPMVYPSHYWKGSFGYEEPNSYPYEIVRNALERAVERSAGLDRAGATRPWLQDFTLGSPRYEAPEVRAQIQATYDAGNEEWVLWNPGSRYTEAALEPVDGFAEEPLVRIANEIVPVSRRLELYGPATPVVEADSAGGGAGAADGTEAPPAADTIKGRGKGPGGVTGR